MLFAQLFLAHLLGDFVFQPRRLLLQKEAKKARSWFFYVHILVHFALPLLLLGDPGFWKWALVIALSHGLIDLARLYLGPRFRLETVPFLLDQGAHLLVLFLVSTYPDTLHAVKGFWGNLNWAWVAGLVFVTYPSAVLMGKLLESLGEEIPTDHKSLPRAGMYIGILERLLVFLFIMLDRWEAIGLLIAAKSVFRFNDLKESNNRKWTEYILIGTLLSFGLAILTGLAVR